jgi:hypothetical protein
MIALTVSTRAFVMTAVKAWIPGTKGKKRFAL